MIKRLRNLLFERDVLRLMGMAILVRPIGLVTQMLMANYFGAGPRYDAYILAVFLVNFVQMAFGRVFTAVVVPFAINLRKDSTREGFYGFISAAWLVFLVPGAMFAALSLVRPDWLVRLAGPVAPTETRALAEQMLRFMAVPGLVLLIAWMGKATLNLNRRFGVAAAIPIINGVVFLGCLVVLQESLGIWALPAAFAAGILAQFILSVVWNYASESFRPTVPVFPPGAAGRLATLSWMIFVSTVFQTVNAFLDRMFASGLVPGSISSIAYSNTLMNFGLQLFSFSLVTVMFTRMSELLSDDRMAELDDYIATNLVKMSRLIVPACLAMSMISTELVRVLFERGAFTPEDTVRTAGALAMYLLGLPALILNSLVTRVFHSLQRMRAKMWLSLQYLVTNAAGNFLLVKSLKVMGLAVSSSVAINVHLFLSLAVLHAFGVGIDARRYTGVILQYYALGLATWFVIRYSGVNAIIDGRFASPGLFDLVLMGALKFIAVGAVYGALYLLTRRVSVRRASRRT